MVSQAMLNADMVWTLFMTTFVAGVGFTTGQSVMRAIGARLSRRR